MNTTRKLVPWERSVGDVTIRSQLPITVNLCVVVGVIIHISIQGRGSVTASFSGVVRYGVTRAVKTQKNILVNNGQ